MTKPRSPDSTLELGEIAAPEGTARYEPKPGDGVGPYVLEEALGRGGMGHVFQAYDAKLDRRVAIKFVTVFHVSSVPRFVAEARVTARCTHPNIVVIHDISEHQGAPFMVLELLRGRSASQLLREGPMPADQVLEIMLQVARALHHAHKQGIVHRDLKPANIFVTDDDIVKVLDFGIAKLLADPLAVELPGDGPVGLPGHTAVGQLIGTFEYMSPEQMTTGQIDHRTDIWAFGLTMYQLLDGARPFEGATELELLAHARAVDEPMPSLRGRFPELPAAVVDLVDRCLAKRPEDRPQDAATLIRALRTDPLSDPNRAPPVRPAPSGIPESEKRTTVRTQVRFDPDDDPEPRPPRRWPRYAALAALVGVLALAGGLLWWRRARPPADDERQSIAHVARLAAELDRHLAAGDRGGAEALVQAFVTDPAHLRTSAASLAWQAWGQRLVERAERDGALAAYAQAYLGARGDRARLAPLAAIAELDVADQAWDRLGAVLAVLDGIPGGRAVALEPRVLHDLAQGVVGGEERAPAAWRAVARALAVGSPGPAPMRRLARVQLDDDAADELLVYDGTKVTANDVGGAVTHKFDLPLLDDLRCAADVGNRIVVIGGRPGGHAATLYDRNGHELSSTPVDGWRCNTADRDGDGIPEIYVYGAGKLLELKLDGGDDLASTVRSSWSLGSEVSGVSAVPGGDGKSLLVSAGEWRGFDLRLVGVADDHTLALRDRVRLGLVTRPMVVRRRGNPVLHAALVQHNYPSRKALGPDDPTGAPEGLYLFDIGADHISVRGRIDVPTGDNATLVVADLDGDGNDELLVSACIDERCGTTVFLMDERGGIERFWLAGLEVMMRLQADEDPADEVAAADADRRLWVLGTGSRRVPLRGLSSWAPARPPGALDRTSAGQWQRAEDLARIGLTAAAATSFRTLRSLSTDPQIQDAALERAATLLADGGDEVAAAAAWTELASTRHGAAAATARLRALEAHRDAHQLVAARPLLDALLTDGLATLSPDERLRLDGLRAELAAPSISLVDRDRPSDAWRVIDPTGFYLDPASGGLVVDSTTAAPVIATAAVHHDGGPLMIRCDLTMTRAEWAGELTLELAPRPAPRGGMYMGLRGGGGGQAIRRLAGLSAPTAYVEGAHPMASVDTPVHALLIVTRVAGDRLRVRWEIEGSPPWEQGVRVSIPPGDYDLNLVNGVPGEVASGVARLHQLTLIGFSALPRSDAERAASAAAAALSRNDARAALAALDRTAPADAWDGARLRAIALQLLGRTDEARGVLRAALAAGPPDPKRHAARIVDLAWLRRVRDGQFAALARAAAGDDLITLEAVAWRSTGYQHLYEPRVQERLAEELADLPPGKGAQLEARAQLYLLRGTALAVMKRTDEARGELERAFRTSTAAELRQEAAVQLATDAAAAGDARDAWRWVEAGLDVANDPLWVADQLLLDPALRALSVRPDWGRLRQFGRVVPSDIRTISDRVP